jgi:hypothetical protein
MNGLLGKANSILTLHPATIFATVSWQEMLLRHSPATQTFPIPFFVVAFRCGSRGRFDKFRTLIYKYSLQVCSRLNTRLPFDWRNCRFLVSRMKAEIEWMFNFHNLSTWGTRYGHYFRRFLPVFGNKWRFSWKQIQLSVFSRT